MTFFVTYRIEASGTKPHSNTYHSHEALRYMENNITVIGGGTLAVILAKLKRKPYEVTRIKHDEAERIKKLGVYYMRIDDLPL